MLGSEKSSSTVVPQVPVLSASSGNKPVGEATTVTTTTMRSFLGTGTGTRTGVATGTGSHAASSTLPFADGADGLGAPGVVVGVMGWMVLML